MNYYNQSLYQNYPQQQPQYQYTQPATYGLSGKFVDSLEMVKAAEVPFGSYGVFPKADFSEIYIKSWNQNGTTNIINFKPAPTSSEVSPVDNELKRIWEKIASLENQISGATSKEKEMSANAY